MITCTEFLSSPFLCDFVSEQKKEKNIQKVVVTCFLRHPHSEHRVSICFCFRNKIIEHTVDVCVGRQHIVLSTQNTIILE